jgi:hypothetical protein
MNFRRALTEIVSICMQGLGIFLFTIVSRTALEPTRPSIQYVSGVLSLGLKRPGRETDHSAPSSTEVKNAWSYTSTPQYVFLAWCSVKRRDNFTFYAFPHVIPLSKMIPRYFILFTKAMNRPFNVR